MATASDRRVGRAATFRGRAGSRRPATATTIWRVTGCDAGGSGALGTFGIDSYARDLVVTGNGSRSAAIGVVDGTLSLDASRVTSSANIGIEAQDNDVTCSGSESGTDGIWGNT
jgi:hypothetical protein